VFTGLIQSTGTIANLTEGAGTLRITVEAPSVAARLTTGDSVAVSGVCLTALDITAETFHAELAAETIARTSLSRLAIGSVVNLELPTPAGAPLGGHVVQGHVDATGTLLALEAVSLTADSARTDWWLRVAVPPAVAPFVVEKGSIAIEGISLTVARWDGREELAVAIIPHTYQATNLHTLTPGSPVNLEADVLMKLARQQPAPEPRFELTVEYLIANGY
jgi:riboflavin synthase